MPGGSKNDVVESHLRAKKHTDAEMKHFIRETSSQKGLRNLAIKNHKAANQLGESEKKLAVESRLAAQKRTKQQRELEEQLQALKVEKERIALHKARERQESRLSMRTPVSSYSDEDELEDDFTSNPYPIALRTDSVDNMGAAYLRSGRGRRRQSHEFEDLDLNTTTGKLLPALRRCRSRGSLTSLSSVGQGQRSGSYSSLNKDMDRDWAGHPETISSVRRPRRTIEQQQRDTILAKVTSGEKISRNSRPVVTSSARTPIKAVPHATMTSSGHVTRPSSGAGMRAAKGTSGKKNVK